MAKLTLEQYETIVSLEDKDDDGIILDDWINMFYSGLIGLTFHPKQVLNGLKEFLEDKEEAEHIYEK